MIISTINEWKNIIKEEKSLSNEDKDLAASYNVNNETVISSIFNSSNSEEEIRKKLELLKELDNEYYASQEFMFFNFLEFSRFINTSDPHVVAYTTPDRLIYLNYLHQDKSWIPNEDWAWNFVFAHECLHQIYDTFAVGDRIRKELGEDKYLHQLLNIAADCVINETLMRRFGKQVPDNLITASYIKKQYNVSYNFMKDTQFTLYVRCLEAVEKNKELLDKMMNDPLIRDIIEQHKKSQKQNPGGSPGGPGKKGKGKGKGEGEGPDGKPSEPGKEGKEGEEDGAEGSDGNKRNTGGPKKGSYSNGEFDEYSDLIDYYDDPPEYSVDDLIKKSKNTLTGPIGEFIDKIKKIPTQIQDYKQNKGVLTKVQQGNKSDYMKELFNNTRSILTNKLVSLRTEYERTYNRTNRRNPFPQNGIINKGTQKIYDKTDITLSFYVDVSGSMGDEVVNKIFKDLYANDKKIKDQYVRAFSEILNDVVFNYFAFNESIDHVTNRQIPHSSGGNVSLDTLINYMKKNTQLSLINVIVTDAGFEINNDKIIKAAEGIDGYIIVLTNDVSNWSSYKTIKKDSKGKITSIYTQSF